MNDNQIPANQPATYVEAMLNALRDVSPKVNGQPIVVPGEVYDAALTIIAYVVAGSNDCASPTKTRLFCEGAGKALRKRVEAVQQGMASGQIPRPNMKVAN